MALLRPTAETNPLPLPPHNRASRGLLMVTAGSRPPLRPLSEWPALRCLLAFSCFLLLSTTSLPPFFLPYSSLFILTSFLLLSNQSPQITLSSQGAPSRLKGLELLCQDVYNHKRMSSWCLPPIIIMSWVEQVTCPYQEKHWGLGLV